MLYSDVFTSFDTVNEYIKFYEFIKKNYKICEARCPNLLNNFTIKLKYNIEVIGGVKVKYEQNVSCEFYIVNQYDHIISNANHSYDKGFDFNILYGRIKLKTVRSRTLIRPERLSDKFIELLNKREVDFDSHQTFSNMYYVLSDDEEEFRQKVTFDFLDYLETINGLTLEFNQDELIFYLPKTNDFEESIRLLDIGYNLNMLLN